MCKLLHHFCAIIFCCLFLYDKGANSSDTSICHQSKVIIITTDDIEIQKGEDNKFQLENKCKSDLKQCKAGFIQLGSHCYHFNNTHPIQWQEAIDRCKCLGAELAHPINAKEDLPLKRYLRTLYPSDHWWLGGSDIAKEGEWIWAHSGEKFTYAPWPSKPQRPDNYGGNQNCLLYWVNTEWDDIACNYVTPYICQH